MRKQRRQEKLPVEIKIGQFPLEAVSTSGVAKAFATIPDTAQLNNFAFSQKPCLQTPIDPATCCHSRTRITTNPIAGDGLYKSGRALGALRATDGDLNGAISLARNLGTVMSRGKQALDVYATIPMYVLRRDCSKINCNFNMSVFRVYS